LNGWTWGRHQGARRIPESGTEGRPVLDILDPSSVQIVDGAIQAVRPVRPASG
jgi:hypothetical protein